MPMISELGIYGAILGSVITLSEASFHRSFLVLYHPSDHSLYQNIRLVLYGGSSFPHVYFFF